MYKLSPKLVYLLKCGFLVLVAAAFLKIVLLKPDPEKEEDYKIDTFDTAQRDAIDFRRKEADVKQEHQKSKAEFIRTSRVSKLDENYTDFYRDERFTLELLQENFETCLITRMNDRTTNEIPVEDSEIPDARRKTKNRHEKQAQNVVPKTSCYDSTLAKFKKLLESLHVKVALIEPSILYCMLLPTYQELLMKRNFNISSFEGSKGIITFAILQQDVFILEEEEKVYKFRKHGFRSHFIRRPSTDWMIKSTPILEFTDFTSHIFYTHKACTFHVVVFHNRGNYMWHDAFVRNEKQGSPTKKLLFVDNTGAYEKFDFVLLTAKDHSSASFYIPSYPHHFLSQMLSSRFMECRTSNTQSTTDNTNHPKSHPGLSVERFNRRTVVVIRQLKTIFQPFLMNLWIWSGTMLGWYRQCDIIPYTTDVDFAAWASELEDLDGMINQLQHDKFVSIKMRMGLLEEGLEFQLDCFKLRTDIFFLYRSQNGSWCSGHSPKEGYYFRYHYPHFTLCSAELLGEKIQVPCETDKVITTEYGPKWFKPVSSWSYESSPRNRGPNIFWSKEKLKDAYQVY